MTWMALQIAPLGRGRGPPPRENREFVTGGSSGRGRRRPRPASARSHRGGHCDGSSLRTRTATAASSSGNVPPFTSFGSLSYTRHMTSISFQNKLYLHLGYDMTIQNRNILSMAYACHIFFNFQTNISKWHMTLTSQSQIFISGICLNYLHSIQPRDLAALGAFWLLQSRVAKAFFAPPFATAMRCSSVALTDRPLRRGLPRPNSHSHWFSS